MKIDLKGLFKGLLKNGIRIGYSSGQAFDPAGQERTDPLEDIAKNKEGKNESHERMVKMEPKAV